MTVTIATAGTDTEGGGRRGRVEGGLQRCRRDLTREVVADEDKELLPVGGGVRLRVCGGG